MILKPLHASWIVKRFNHISSIEGKRLILNGSERAGKVMRLGKDNMLSLDSFDDTDPLLEASNFSNLDQIIMREDELGYEGFLAVVVSDCDDDENDKWIMEENDNERNILTLLLMRETTCKPF